MVFNYERKGNFEGSEVFIFQDLIDSPRSIREMGKVLEKHFQVFYIYLPEPVRWLDPQAISHLKLEAKDSILSLLEESPHKKIGISGGLSYAFWREILGDRENSFLKFYLIHPEWNELGQIGTFLEVLKTYWDRPGFYLLDWIQVQPMAHHLSQAQTIPKRKPTYSIHLVRTEKARQVFQYETKLLLDRFGNVEWSRFACEHPDSLKFSKTIKKFLLMNIAKDYGRKSESYWADIIGL